MMSDKIIENPHFISKIPILNTFVAINRSQSEEYIDGIPERANTLLKG